MSPLIQLLNELFLKYTPPAAAAVKHSPRQNQIMTCRILQDSGCYFLVSICTILRWQQEMLLWAAHRCFSLIRTTTPAPVSVMPSATVPDLKQLHELFYGQSPMKVSSRYIWARVTQAYLQFLNCILGNGRIWDVLLMARRLYNGGQLFPQLLKGWSTQLLRVFYMGRWSPEISFRIIAKSKHAQRSNDRKLVCHWSPLSRGH